MNWIDFNEEEPEYSGVYLCKCVDEFHYVYPIEVSKPYYTVLTFNGYEWEFNGVRDEQKVIAWLDFPECTIGDK